MAEKCDFIVSNTIQIEPALYSVVSHDLHKRHGKYTYLYPNTITIASNLFIGIVTESEAVMASPPLQP